MVHNLKHIMNCTDKLQKYRHMKFYIEREREREREREKEREITLE